MDERVVPKMTNFYVVKLSNSPAITCVPRLEPDHFESQPDSPRINQRFPRIETRWLVSPAVVESGLEDPDLSTGVISASIRGRQRII